MYNELELERQTLLGKWLLVLLSIFQILGVVANVLFVPSYLFSTMIALATVHMLYVVVFKKQSLWLSRFLLHFLLLFPITISITLHIVINSYTGVHIDVFLGAYLSIVLPIMFVAPVVGFVLVLPKWLYSLSPTLIGLQIIFTLSTIHGAFFQINSGLGFYTAFLTVIVLALWVFVGWYMGLQVDSHRETVKRLNAEIEQKNAEQKSALLIQQHKNNLLFAKSDDMLVLLDEGLAIKEVNNIFLDRLQVVEESVLSKSILDFKSNIFNLSDLKFLSKRNSELDHTINDFRLKDSKGETIYTKARIRFSHVYNGVNYFLAILWDVSDLRFRELRDNELMETFSMVMRHLNHNLRGPLSTAMAINQLYTLKYKQANFNEMCEGLTMTSKLLEKIDHQLKRSVRGLEGYEEVWMKDVRSNVNGRVLIIDDNKDDIILLKTVIEDALTGANVISFTEANMGLFYLENSISNNDICFIDIEMPGISGLEIIDTILTQSLKVGALYIVSGHSFAYLAERGFDISKYDFIEGIISKPLKVGVINDVLKNWQLKNR